jgi:D-aminoacyl-tRNA deacylase
MALGHQPHARGDLGVRRSRNQDEEEAAQTGRSIWYQTAVRAVVQRVSRAEVRVAAEVTGRIARGLLVLVAAGSDDSEVDIAYLVDKIVNLRIFSDDAGNMNLALGDVQGALLIVSQFTLYGDCRKGRRPSFIQAMPPEPAEKLYEDFVAAARKTGVPVETGRFRAMMDVELVNDGPVTLLIDSKKGF